MHFTPRLGIDYCYLMLILRILSKISKIARPFGFSFFVVLTSWHFDRRFQELKLTCLILVCNVITMEMHHLSQDYVEYCMKCLSYLMDPVVKLK